MAKVSELTGSPGYLLIFCPACQCAHQLTVEPYDGARWTYNNDPERPTFSPSLLVRYPRWTPPVTPENMDEYNRNPWPQTQVEAVCHSFITDGKIQFLADCTHELAGQTVELGEI